MGQALYRSYRPKKLADVVGQELVTTALKHALEKGTVSHAYLFTGPRGTGKTTIARILAHEINGLPYDENGAMHLDIIEIDAASNRRIDEIRDLRDKVNLAPAAAKFKVYIIDEVHMLTREAFNALLKTLEEPPKHVVFILATTEAHKLPETIISRTQHFAFRPYTQSEVVVHLRKIAEQEKISIDDDALALIAEHGEGTFRDSISLLDQLRNQTEEITLADVQASLGIAPEQAVAELLAAMRTHDAAKVAMQLTDLHERGYEPTHLAKQLGQAARKTLLEKKTGLQVGVSLNLLAQLVAVPASPDPRVALEIAVLDATFAGETVQAAAPKSAKTSSAEVEAKPVNITEPHPSAFAKKISNVEKPTVPEASAEEAKPKTEMPKIESKPAKTKAAFAEDGDDDTLNSNATLDAAKWAEVLAAIKPKYNTLYGIISAASPTFDPGKITLTSAFAFHQKRLKEPKNKEIIAHVIEEVTGEALRIDAVVGHVDTAALDLPTVLPPADGEVVHTVGTPAPTISNAPETQAPAPTPAMAAASTPNVAKTTDPIAAVSNIFGGAELLQS